LTLLYFSAQNIDRLVSFYRASLRGGKIFAIDFYTANILGCLKDYGEIPYPSKCYALTSEFSSLTGCAGE
jgi:ribonuclease J